MPDTSDCYYVVQYRAAGADHWLDEPAFCHMRPRSVGFEALEQCREYARKCPDSLKYTHRLVERRIVDTPLTEGVCERFVGWAREAVDDWDGLDHGDLLRFLAERMGVPLADLVEAGRKIVERDSDG